VTIRLTSVQRRLLSRTFFIGAALTLMVVVAEQFKLMEPLERFFYDRRAYWFQYFTPAPSKDIVHVSLDDATLADVGRWPWPREYLAIIIDEFRLAGARVIALDMILSEPQLPRWRPLDAENTRFQKIEDDVLLGEACHRAGNVLIAAAAGEWRTNTVRPAFDAMVRILAEDLEQPTEQLEASLGKDGFSKEEVSAAITNDFLRAFEQAMFQRMEAAIVAGAGSMEELRKVLTPQAEERGQRTDAVIVAEQVYRRLDAIRRLHRFSQPITPQTGPLLRSVTQAMLAPVQPLSDGAIYSGYVDFLQSDDGIVRSVPLVANFDGRAYPHMAFATACAALGVPFSAVKIEADRLTLPLPDGRQIVVPVRQAKSPAHGRIGAFLDLAWIGLRDPWWSMYDFPHHIRPAQQDTLKNLWRIEEFRRSLRKNDSEASAALQVLAGAVGQPATEEAIREWPTASTERKAALLTAVLEDEIHKQYYDLANQPLPEGEVPDENSVIIKRAYEALQYILRNSKYIEQRIAETRAQLRERYNDKVILVGATAAGLYDYYPTSLHAQCPGVMIQGVAVNGILTGHFLRTAPTWVEPLLTILMGGLITFVVAVLPSYRALLATIFLALCYLFLNGFVFYDWLDLLVPAAGAMTVCVLVWGILTLYRYIFESAERQRITARFSSYVDPSIVTQVIEDPDSVRFNGQVREMTVVFTDLAGFTTISEKLQERTVPLLNDYMSRMMPVIRRNGGTWNKFLGDGIMFFYNAPRDDPDHAAHAVRTVLEMLAAMKPFNEELAKKELPAVSMRAGITTGFMIAGDAGSITASDPQYAASDYTVLGDNVNLAARLESANKALGSQILCVERTVELMGNGVLCRPMAKLQVVGKTQGVMTFEPMCFEGDATSQMKQTAEFSKLVVDAYAQARFADCLSEVQKMEAAVGESKFTKLYKLHAKEFLEKGAGEDFDGTIVLEAK
jgi:class 3 adenylate cyclase/CHASE2 domain-containing sensor protein